MSRPRIALIGAGTMGARHARVLATSEDCSLVSVIDPDEHAGRSVAEEYGVPWRPELATCRGINGIVLAAPTETHHKIALDVLGNDVPLLVEKPVCGDLDDTIEVLRLAGRRDVPVLCGLLERHNPAVRTVLALIREPVHVATVRHGPYLNRMRTGVGWDLAVHDMDIAIRCFDAEPTRVSATTLSCHPQSAAGAEDVLEAALEFGHGMATVSASRIAQQRTRTLRITELDRAFDVDLLHRKVIEYRGRTVINLPMVSTMDPLTAQLDRFLGLLDGSVDHVEERESILPAHRVVAAALTSGVAPDRPSRPRP